MRYCASAGALKAFPGASAIAVTVVVEETGKAPVYIVESAVGRDPSVV